MINIIKRPLVSEKSSRMAENNVYTFEVDRRATKDEIKKAVEKAFQVKVKAIRTSVCRGRAKKTKHGLGAVPYWKKALVKLHKDQTISLFEGV